MLRWKRELDLKTHGALPTVILANKADPRVSDKDVWGEEDLAMEELVQEVGAAAWTRTSALTGEGVEEAVRVLVWHILDREAASFREEMARSDSIIQLPVHKEPPPPRSQCQC